MARLLLLAIVAFVFIYVSEVVSLPNAPGVSGTKACPPVKCPGKPKQCTYGYQKKDGCEICKCNNPCNPPKKAKICPTGQRCSVEKKADGTFGTRCDTAGSKKGKDDKDKTGTSNAACSLPKVTGKCRALLPRFYYNAATKSCEAFNYGGCGGNENNFPTKAACEAACKV